MKRHADLIHFSREHHAALRLGNHILKAPAVDHSAEIERERAALLQHFDAEEAQFAPYWAHLQCPDLQQRFQAQHAQLRALLQQTPFQAQALGECLIAHVRFEERELFEALGQMLEREQNDPAQSAG